MPDNQPPHQLQTPQPVAYDTNGRPLYAHPPVEQPAQNSSPTQPTQIVYMSRPFEPHAPEIPEHIRERSDADRKVYPHLNLSDGEYVISDVHRHPIGLLSIWFVVVIAITSLFVVIPMILTNDATLSNLGVSDRDGFVQAAALVLIALAALFVLGGAIATYIYNDNRFYLTNESVIQHIRHSLFSHKMQTISLANIEDASYRRQGILQTILNYGSIRLSTEGDETTYRFNYVYRPHRQIDLLNNAVESFKNGRAFSDPDEN